MIILFVFVDFCMVLLLTVLWCHQLLSHYNFCMQPSTCGTDILKFVPRLPDPFIMLQ